MDAEETSFEENSVEEKDGFSIISGILTAKLGANAMVSTSSTELNSERLDKPFVSSSGIGLASVQES